MMKPDERQKAGQDKIVSSESMSQPPSRSGQDSAQESDHPAGAIVEGKFKILSVLGHGGMGTVYKVEQILLKKYFALKTMHKGSFSENSWRRFQKEAQTISKLDHPNIIHAHDFGLIDGSQPYLLMDLAEGETLSQIIRRTGQLSLNEALELFIPVCFALSYAHDKGVIHRDLKPSNIIIPTGKWSEPKIVDFGIAKVVDTEEATLTKTGEVFGTPFYMSPEQCRGDQIDSRCDIYSLGCVLFEALTGTPPFPGNSAVSIIAQHLSATAPSLRESSLGLEYPAQIERIVASMLAKSRDDRPQKIDQIARELIEVKKNVDSLSPRELLVASGQAGSNTLKPSASQRSARFFTAGGIICALLAGLLLGYSLQPQPPAKAPSTPSKEAAAPLLAPIEALREIDKGDEDLDLQPYITPEGTALRVSLPKDARHMRIYGRSLSGKQVELINGETEVLRKGELKAQFSASWAGLHPGYLLRFAPGDLTEIDFSGEDKDSPISRHLGRICLSSIAYMTSVHTLLLQGNYFDEQGLSSVSHFPLTAFSSDKTAIAGDAIAKLPSFPNLTQLYLVEPKHLTALLEQLALNNHVIGSLSIKGAAIQSEDLKQISKSTTLDNLTFEECSGFSEDNIGIISRMPSLKRLDLANSQIDDAICKKLVTLPKLLSLTLRKTRVTEACAPALAKLKRLQFLNLAGTKLNDASMAQLGALTDLHTLDITDTNVTRASMPVLEQLAHNHLRVLTITGQAGDTSFSTSEIERLRSLGVQVQ